MCHSGWKARVCAPRTARINVATCIMMFYKSCCETRHWAGTLTRKQGWEDYPHLDPRSNAVKGLRATSASIRGRHRSSSSWRSERADLVFLNLITFPSLQKAVFTPRVRPTAVLLRPTLLLMSLLLIISFLFCAAGTRIQQPLHAPPPN